MRLNKIQKIILIIYALVVLGLCVYVPWLGKTPQYSELQSIGYAPIWSYPKTTKFAGNVDLPTLRKDEWTDLKEQLSQLTDEELDLLQQKLTGQKRKAFLSKESLYQMPEQFRTPLLVMCSQLSDEHFYKWLDNIFETPRDSSSRVFLIEYCNWRLRQVKPIKIDSKRLLFELFAATIVFGVAVVVVHKYD